MYTYINLLLCLISIEYWPDPQLGIKEAYGVQKPGGKTCIIGPVYPTFWLSRIFAYVWMLFPKEEYFEWYKKAGFVDVKLKRIGPTWYRDVSRHGLIIGCCVVGTKPASRDSPLQTMGGLRFIQHKKEALWFYRFISIAYDTILNPPHWNLAMRDGALEPLELNDPNLVVVDVGGGTGFATEGVVKYVDAKNVTLLDQSPEQMAKAKRKPALKEVTIIQGDAEDLPFPTDYADRYVSAGSIEYWPDPQRGIKEAYRVLKPGGKACIIGPVYPTFWLSRMFADVWMLFPKEEEYFEWYKKAGFVDVKLKRIGPTWYRGVRRHGLIIGCSVVGTKPAPGDSPLQMGPKAEDVESNVNPIMFLIRFIPGYFAAYYFMWVSLYMGIKNFIFPSGIEI